MEELLPPASFRGTCRSSTRRVRSNSKKLHLWLDQSWGRSRPPISYHRGWIPLRGVGQSGRRHYQVVELLHGPGDPFPGWEGLCLRGLSRFPAGLLRRQGNLHFDKGVRRSGDRCLRRKRKRFSQRGQNGRGRVAEQHRPVLRLVARGNSSQTTFFGLRSSRASRGRISSSSAFPTFASTDGLVRARASETRPTPSLNCPA